jgi:hypothetical protein
VVSFTPFFAEVLDKEPDALTVWLAYGALSLAGFFACRWRPWCFALFGPLNSLAAWASMSELWDPHVGPEILRESPPLFIQWHLALTFALAGPVAGFILSLRKHKRPEGRRDRDRAD